MGVSRATRWENLKGRPTTVAGLGLTDFNAQAIAAQAAATVGAVGTFAFMQTQNTTSGLDVGTVFAGSTLRYAHTDSGTNSATVPIGTWRLLGFSGATYAKTLFVRIS